MQVLKSEQDVCSIELGCVLLKAPNLTQVEEKLTAWAIFKTEIKLARSLESKVHFDDELVVHAFL